MNDHPIASPEDMSIAWIDMVFPAHIGRNPIIRTVKLFEEVSELAQVENVEPARLHAIIDQVFARPAGTREEEFPQIVCCLYSLAGAINASVADAFFYELTRVADPELMKSINAKHFSKPTLALFYSIPYFRPAMDYYKHRARQSTYFTLAEADLQSSKGPIAEGERLQLYFSEDDPTKVYARPLDEFNDGRFEQLSLDLHYAPEDPCTN